MVMSEARLVIDRYTHGIPVAEQVVSAACEVAKISRHELERIKRELKGVARGFGRKLVRIPMGGQRRRF